MRIVITKDDGSEIETNTIALARKLNNIVVYKMEEQYMKGWDQADFINCMIDTIDTMFAEKEFK